MHAISLSIGDLAALMERVEGEAQDMLAFQLAMLEDDALSAPALASIESGCCGAHGMVGCAECRDRGI